MDIDLGGKVKPEFPKTLFDWFVENGFTSFVKLSGKVPANKGRWRLTESHASIVELTRQGFNFGAVIPPGFLVLDIDPRNGGLESLARLLGETSDDFGPRSIDDLIKGTFAVRSGAGGLHLYYSHDQSLRPVSAIEGLPGIDVKTSGNKYVVAPGGVHPETGNTYLVLNQPAKIAPLPDLFASRILKEKRDPLAVEPGPERHSLWCLVTADELRTLLDVLDPKRYRNYLGDSSWLNLMSAAHHATGGDPEAMQVFADWSAQDPDYAGEAHKAVERKWDTFRDRRSSDKHVATVRTLLAAVDDARREADRLGEAKRKHRKAANTTGEIRLRISAADLDPIGGDGNDPVSELHGYIEDLPNGWQQDDRTLLPAIVERIAELPDDYWTDLSKALAAKTEGKRSQKAIERLIRKKHEAKRKEEKRAKLTPAEIVDTAARRALKALSPDPGDLLRPPKAPFYIYRDGYWQPFHEEIASKRCFDELEGFLDKTEPGLRPLPYYAREAFNQLSYMAGTDSTDLYNRQELPSCVNLINGTLHFYSDGNYELKPHNREDYLVSRLPYSYDPNAKCPSMMTMLTQVFDHVRTLYSEEEMWELIRHFWEFAGYILQPKKDIPVMMFWLGEGFNGKSKIASIITKLLDPKALLSTDLLLHLDPSNKHGSAALEGKLLAMDDDAGEDSEISDRIFKKICQSKPFDINPKNKDARQIMLQTIVLFIANNGVKIVDTSPGFSRRCYVIDFSNNISHLQNSPLPDIVESKEMSGVLNEAVKGLSRLRKRGFFDVPKCAQDYKTRFLVHSNSVLSFWDSCDKTESEGERVRVQDLYNGYRFYMSNGNYGKAASLKSFVKALQRQGVIVDGNNITNWKINITV